MTTFVTLLLFLVLCLVAFLPLYLLVRLVIATVRLLLPSDIGRLTPRAIILAAGITAVLFSDTVTFLVREPILLFLDAFRLFSSTLQQALEQVSLDEFDGVGSLMLDELSILMPQFIDRLHQTVYGLSIPATFAFLAVFYLIANALSADDEADSALLRIRGWYSKLDPTRRSGLLLTSAVGVGAYLAIAAILTLPWISGVDDSNPQEQVQLRVRLESLAVTDEKWDERWPPVLFRISPLEPVESLFSDTPEAEAAREELILRPLGEPRAGASAWEVEERNSREENRREQMDRLRNDFFQFGVAIDQLEHQWTALRTNARRHQEQARRAAVDAYGRYVDKDLTETERQKYRDQLVRWYEGSSAEVEQMLGDFKGQSSWLAREWNQWARDVREGDTLDYRTETYLPPLDAIMTSFDPSAFGVQAPAPQVATEQAFTVFFAGWLLAAENYDLTLLSGMIGFGLIGSIVARVLSPKIEEGDGADATARSTFDVIFVGVTASMIIFLAGQGGLAIVATGGSHPNPYVLFLAALVGAAFGDRVWETARDRLVRALEKQAAEREAEAEQHATPNGTAPAAQGEAAKSVPVSAPEAPAGVAGERDPAAEASGEPDASTSDASTEADEGEDESRDR